MMYTSFDNTGMLKVLSYLKSHNSEFLSGQDLSDILKISRVAVWKHVKKIRSLGYNVESKHRLGYKLTDSTDQLLPWEITQNLDTKLLGKRVFYFGTLDSTQNFAAKISSNQNENGSIVISKRQTDGKGRMKRKWESPAGGVWMSIIIQPEFNISYITLVPIATSLALCIAIEKTLKIKPKLKWPNDILMKEKKVAGILLDTSIQSNKIESIILGIGINFKINPHRLENNIKKTPNFYGVDTLVKKNEKPITLIKQFLYELENIFQLIDSGYTKKIITEWTIRSSTIGKNISIITNEGKITGNAIKLDSDGALIISKGQKNKRLLVGDITHKN